MRQRGVRAVKPQPRHRYSTSKDRSRSSEQREQSFNRARLAVLRPPDSRSRPSDDRSVLPTDRGSSSYSIEMENMRSSDRERSSYYRARPRAPVAKTNTGEEIEKIKTI